MTLSGATLTVAMSELGAACGRVLGPSAPVAIGQQAIDEFAGLTGDVQWIHCDPVKARSGPNGATIAHGFHVLALAGGFWTELLEVTDTGTGVNYGFDRVRFLAPVPVGSSVRMRATLAAVEARGRGIRLTAELEFLVDGMERPVVVATQILLYQP